MYEYFPGTSEGGTVMKKLIYLLLLVMTLVSCQQETIPQDTGRSSVPPLFSFTLTETGAILTAYNGRETAVIIPESWEGLPVTAIEGAFTGNTTLTAVEIPDSVTMIGDHSFSGCTALREINFPDGLKKIGDGRSVDARRWTKSIFPIR